MSQNGVDKACRKHTSIHNVHVYKLFTLKTLSFYMRFLEKIDSANETFRVVLIMIQCIYSGTYSPAHAISLTINCQI